MAYDAPLKRAFELAGGPTAVARHLSIVPSAVTQWERVPARHVGRVGALVGMEPHELRPDLFPIPPAAPVAPPTQEAA